MSCSCDGVCDGRDTVKTPMVVKRIQIEMRILTIRFVTASLFFVLGLISPIIAPDLVSVWLSRGFFILSWLAAGYRVVWNASRNIVKGQVFDENFLMTIATVGAFLIGQWSEGAAVMLFFNLGEMVQESAVSRSRRSIRDLMDVRPDTAWLLPENRALHPSEVLIGSLLLVKPGEKVPLDGIVEDGNSSFDTSSLTGESMPRSVFPGDPALAGFINIGGALRIRTTSVYADTVASKMLDLIENAQHRKAKAEKMITSFARIYTPIVTIGAFLLAFGFPVILSLVNGIQITGWVQFQSWVYRALVFLVISCPCAFVISVPLGFFGGIGGAAKRGILIKGADYIDVLAKAKAVVFDKTGTLTRGVFSVQSIEPASPFSGRDLTSLAASSEWHSNHPVGVALRAYAASNGLETKTDLISDYAERAGYGVYLQYEGKDLRSGSRKFLEESVVSGLPQTEGGRLSLSVGTAVGVALDFQYAGCVILNDEPKADSAEAVSNLRAEGIGTIVMITGDSDGPARDIASKIGITDIRSSVLPHQKVEYFEDISKTVKSEFPKGTVLFVGDGINDAPVLGRADAGIAMGGIGSDAAIEAADVVLMNDSPLLVAEAIKLSRWTLTIVKQNIALSFVVKIGFLALGAFGIATLWEAVFADVGVALLATANSLRARNYKTGTLKPLK